jgi:hypothetical protein
LTWLPEKAYLVRSTGIIPRISGENIERKVSRIVYKDDLLVSALAALCIFDEADPEDELIKFNSSQWRVSGKDIDDLNGRKGVMGIAVANTGDNVDLQLGNRLLQVEGADPNDAENDGDYTLNGVDAILQDPGLLALPDLLMVRRLGQRSIGTTCILLSPFGVPDSKDSFHKIYLLERRGLPGG